MISRALFASSVDESLQIIRYRVELRVLKLFRASPVDENRTIVSLICPLLVPFQRTLMALPLQGLDECLHETRLAQASFADHEDNLTHSFLRLFPPIFEKTQFGISPRQRRLPRLRGAPLARIGVRSRPLIFFSKFGEIHRPPFQITESCVTTTAHRSSRKHSTDRFRMRKRHLHSLASHVSAGCFDDYHLHPRQSRARLASRTRTISLAGFLMMAGLIGAIGQEAKVRTSLSTQGDVYVGQRLTLVVELLAPGFFASAATFDLPDPQGVLLMPPTEHPIVSSEDIDGVSYSVQRHELFDSQSAEGRRLSRRCRCVSHLSARRSIRAKVSASVTTDPVEFTVLLPPGAEGLGNVISARNLKVEETWKPELGKTTIKPGDAFTRTIIFSAPNLPGMVFPPFPGDSIDGLGLYAKHQILDQTERGELRGERRDVITYVFQRSGEFTIPAARLSWWDLDNKELRSIDFPTHIFNVVDPPPQTSSSKSFAWWQPALALLIALALALLCYARLRPLFSAVLARFLPVHLAPLNPPPGNQ